MIGIIVAKSRNNVIGKDGKIPWKIKGEQLQFKELTQGNTVIMGRKTYEDIGKPLPNRKNIVISKTKKYIAENLITVTSLKEALSLTHQNETVYIIGGYNLFKEAIPIVNIMYVTEINQNIIDGDTFFPYFNEEDFNKYVIESNDEYKRLVYKRKNKLKER